MHLGSSTVLLVFYMISTTFPPPVVTQGISRPTNLVKARRTCYSILRTPAATRERLERQQFDEADPDVHCAVRCFGISSGMYDDERGTNLDLALRTIRGHPRYGEYRRALVLCLRAISGTIQRYYADDYCRKSYAHFQCTRWAWQYVGSPRLPLRGRMENVSF